jgi:hypothetical protein
MEIIIRSIMEIERMTYWQKFMGVLQTCIQEMGHSHRVLGCKDLYPDDPFPEQISIFPHCRKQVTPTGRLFYKEMYLKGLFTLDSLGWGPDHSAIQSSPPLGDIGDDEALELVDRLRKEYFANGDSKVQQPLTSAIDEHLKPYWLVPLQQEKDQVIKYHSPSSVVAFMHLIADWAEKNQRNIIFKVHPCDTTEQVTDAVDARIKNSRYLSRHSGSIHALIESAMGVVVINSGTGFESLIHGSPVATFGACDYKWATFSMTDNNLDKVDNYFLNYSQKQQMNTYRFLYHYFYHYAFETRNNVDAKVKVRVKAIIQQAIDHYQTE